MHAVRKWVARGVDGGVGVRTAPEGAGTRPFFGSLSSVGSDTLVVVDTLSSPAGDLSNWGLILR